MVKFLWKKTCHESYAAYSIRGYQFPDNVVQHVRSKWKEEENSHKLSFKDMMTGGGCLNQINQILKKDS